LSCPMRFIRASGDSDLIPSTQKRLLTSIILCYLDNAPIHTSKAFKEKIAQWRQKKLEIFWLPTYSPQLRRW
jgi:transposase